MSRKHNPTDSQVNSTSEMIQRIGRTRGEGKFQQALDLAKQLYKYEPTPEHRELLKAVYLERGEQLRARDMLNDAATVFENAANLDAKNPSFIAKVAEELARCGQMARGMALFAGLDATSETDAAQQKMRELAVDGAFRLEKCGRSSLPADLQSDYDTIVLAFQQVEQGQDEQARETLQKIGLRSPFMEWKVLLRGFQAYYQHQDDRAVENWQRLNPQRLPARIAAPFRVEIDKVYAAAQQPEALVTLKNQFRTTSSEGPGSVFTKITKALCHPEKFSSGLRMLEANKVLLESVRPELRRQLARACYWAILKTGPHDIPVYKRIFGAPPDDKEFNRLNALGSESANESESVHKSWAAFEKEIAKNPSEWPGDTGRIARALIWQRMGDNAASVPTEKVLKRLPSYLRGMGPAPKPLHPGPETCFAHSLELAPEILETHELHLKWLAREEKKAEIISASSALLARFPDHVSTLQFLSRYYLNEENPQKALECLEQALRHHPLNREFRREMGFAHQLWARSLVEQNNITEARLHYERALSFDNSADEVGIYTRWAMAELKGGNADRSEELLTKARAAAPGDLLVHYMQLVETNRLKLPNTLKTKLTRVFNKEIEQKSNPATAVELVKYASRIVTVGYYGQPTHTKKIISYATEGNLNQYTESQFQEMFIAITNLKITMRNIANLYTFAKNHFHTNPHFPYHMGLFLMGDDPDESVPIWRVLMLFEHAESLARKKAGEPEMKEMLEDIAHRKTLISALNPFLAMSNLIGNFGGIFPFETDDFDDDD